MRSILDAIRGDVPLFAPGRQLANSALHQLTEGWKGLGSPGLNQGQHPALTSAPYKAEDAPNPGHPPEDGTDGKRPHVGLVTRLAPSTTGTS